MRNPLNFLYQISQNEYPDIISESIFYEFSNKFRLILIDKSFIDIRVSLEIEKRFDFHWERRHIDETIYRYDNFPDIKWKKVKTFPCHLHFGKENKIIAAHFRKDLEGGFRDFMDFARKELKK